MNIGIRLHGLSVFYNFVNQYTFTRLTERSGRMYPLPVNRKVYMLIKA